MRFEKNTTLLLAIILSSTTLAAPAQGGSTSMATQHVGQVPSTILAPLPALSKQAAVSTSVSVLDGHQLELAKKAALAAVPVAATPAPAATPVAATPAPSNQTLPAATNQPVATNQSVYADTPVAQAAAAPQPVAEGELNVPYETMLPKGAELVAGDPTKNEFFIVAAEDAVQIKKLLERPAPNNNAELAANDIKSKKPILKVKLDAANTTLVSMDVVSSIHEVVKSAQGPKVAMTTDDEVLSIFTKNHITPVGSRVVKPASTLAPVKPTLTALIDEKPIMKLFAAQNIQSSGINNKITESINPLASATPVRPAKGTMPEQVAMQQIIQQPIDKPVALPPVSKEMGPTLEMVLQQAKNGKGKINNEMVSSSRSLKSKLVVVTPAVKSKPTASKAPMSTQLKRVVVKAAADKRKIVALGEIIPYETLTAATTASIKPVDKKASSWKVRHKPQPIVEVKKVAVERPKNAKATLQVGVVKSYADYLTKTGQQESHSME